MRLVLAAILFVSAMLLSCAAQAQYPRPRRPERFDTAEQISNYLKELQEYYSVHGRGRYEERPAATLRTAHAVYCTKASCIINKYGKRQMHIADASVIFRESPFFEHNANDETLFKTLGYK